jgi:aminopeptidase N
VYATALADSSNLVIGAAINALAKAPTIESRKQINDLQQSASPSLLGALSNYYALNGGTEHYQWYLSRMGEVSDEDLYESYLQNFATFMLRMPPVERDKGVQRLESYARTHSRDIVRLGAYKALSTMAPSMPTLKSTLLDIRTKEKDTNLKTLYTLLQ